MTLVCRCGVILSVNPDGLLDAHREARLQQRVGEAIVQHVSRDHKADFARAVQFSQLFLSWALLAQFTSKDPEFAGWVESDRQLLNSLVAPPDADQSTCSPAKKETT